MKKVLLLTACFLLSSFILTSAPIDTALSKRVAANFYRERSGRDASAREWMWGTLMRTGTVNKSN